MNSYQKDLEKLAEMRKEALSEQIALYQQLMIGASALLGVLISLYTGRPETPSVRWLFISAITSLTAALLAIGLVLFDRTMLKARLWKAFQMELAQAALEDRKAKTVSVPDRKRTIWLEKIFLVLLPASLVILLLYATAISLFATV